MGAASGQRRQVLGWQMGGGVLACLSNKVISTSATLSPTHGTLTAQADSALGHPDPYGAPKACGLPVCTVPNFPISLISKILKKYLGTDICLSTWDVQNKDIRKNLKQFFLPLIQLFH